MHLILKTSGAKWSLTRKILSNNVDLPTLLVPLSKVTGLIAGRDILLNPLKFLTCKLVITNITSFLIVYHIIEINKIEFQSN